MSSDVIAIDGVRPIVEAGKALYGQSWHTDLAHDLGVNVRTVQRWATSETEPKPGVYPDVARVVEARIAALQDLLGRLA